MCIGEQCGNESWTIGIYVAQYVYLSAMHFRANIVIRIFV